MTKRHVNVSPSKPVNEFERAIELGRQRHNAHVRGRSFDLVENRLGVGRTGRQEESVGLSPAVLAIDEIALEMRTVRVRTPQRRARSRVVDAGERLPK